MSPRLNKKKITRIVKGIEDFLKGKGQINQWIEQAQRHK